MITVGITAVGGGVGQAVLRGISHGNLSIRTVGLDCRAMSAGLYLADVSYLVPSAAEEEPYIKKCLEICKRESVDVLIPGSDPELHPLACHRSSFIQKGCEVIVGDPKIVQLCQDKRALSDFCSDRELSFAKTWTLKEAKDLSHELTFPLVGKPRIGSGSVGAKLIFEPDELFRISDNFDLVIQPYIPILNRDLNHDPPRSWDGKLNQSNEVSAQFMINVSGNVIGHFISINRLKDGVPVEVILDPDEGAVREGLKLVSALAEEGLRGPINLQGRYISDGVCFFEINPRFTGLTGVRTAMGYREIEAAIRGLVLAQEEEASRCLSFISKSVAIRHVEETIVPIERVESIKTERSTFSRKESSIPERILVTGASGYVGANLITELFAIPEIKEVRAIVRDTESGDRLRSQYDDSARLTIVCGELPGSPLPLEGVDVVVHLAALRLPLKQSERGEDFFLVNTEGTRRILQSMDCFDGIRMVFLSSQAVYGTDCSKLCSEAQLVNPETVYGVSKWMGELLCVGKSQNTLESVILRSARVYGFGYFLRWNELPHKFAQKMVKGEPLTVYSSGEQRIDLIHIRDLCGAIVKACSLPLPNPQSMILNVGSGCPISVSQLASLYQTIAADLGLKVPDIKRGSPEKKPPMNFGLDIRRARTYLDWAPEVSIQTGIRELISAALEKKPRHK